MKHVPKELVWAPLLVGGTQGEKVGVLHGPIWMEEAEKAMTTYKRIADLDHTIKLLLLFIYLLILFAIFERGALSRHSDCPFSYIFSIKSHIKKKIN